MLCTAVVCNTAPLLKSRHCPFARGVLNSKFFAKPLAKPTLHSPQKCHRSKSTQASCTAAGTGSLGTLVRVAACVVRSGAFKYLLLISAAVLVVLKLWQGSTTSLRTLYPVIQSHEKGDLRVSDLHTVHYEVFGNPKGTPALVVHGGPGAGCYANHARFFDPTHYRIVLVDQRGCGASTPRGCIVDNTTQDLVADFETLRSHLRISSWVLLGGSWGVALALAYAQTHPSRVRGLVLRGICLMRPSEIDWMYRGGCGALHPKGYSDFLGHLTEAERADPVASFYARLTSPDQAVRDAAARAWLGWEMTVGFNRSKDSLQVWNGKDWSSSAFPAPSASGWQLPSLKNLPKLSPKGARSKKKSSPGAASSVPTIPPPNGPSSVTGTDAQQGNSSAPEALSADAVAVGGPHVSSPLAQALLECHYSAHNAFLADTPLLEGIDGIRHIPCIGVQGRMDFVCPVKTAYDLHCAWPEMELRVVPQAGHSMYDSGITHELLCATDRLRSIPQPSRTRRESRVQVDHALPVPIAVP